MSPWRRRTAVQLDRRLRRHTSKKFVPRPLRPRSCRITTEFRDDSVDAWNHASNTGAQVRVQAPAPLRHDFVGWEPDRWIRPDASHRLDSTTSMQWLRCRGRSKLLRGGAQDDFVSETASNRAEYSHDQPRNWSSSKPCRSTSAWRSARRMQSRRRFAKSATPPGRSTRRHSDRRLSFRHVAAHQHDENASDVGATERQQRGVELDATGMIERRQTLAGEGDHLRLQVGQDDLDVRGPPSPPSD